MNSFVCLIYALYFQQVANGMFPELLALFKFNM